MALKVGPHSAGPAAIGGVIQHVVHKGWLYLEFVNLNTLEIGQARVASTKVINRHLYAQRLQGSYLLLCREQVVHQMRLGQLQPELLRQHPLCAGFTEHSQANRFDQTCLFGQTNEVRRWHRPQQSIVPAQQSLCTLHAARARGQRRLVMQRELVAIQFFLDTLARRGIRIGCLRLR